MSVFSLADIVNLCTFWPKHTLSSTTFTCTSDSVEALYSGCGHIPNTVYAYRHRNIPVYMVASILELPFINAEPTDVTATTPCGLSMCICLLSVDFMNKMCTCNKFPIKPGIFQVWG